MTNAEHRRTAVDIAVIVPHDIAVVDIDSLGTRRPLDTDALVADPLRGGAT